MLRCGDGSPYAIMGHTNTQAKQPQQLQRNKAYMPQLPESSKRGCNATFTVKVPAATLYIAESLYHSLAHSNDGSDAKVKLIQPLQ